MKQEKVNQTKNKRAKTMYSTNRYLNPTNDLAFKKLFGTEDHKDLLISFLNTMLGLEGKRKIKTVEIVPQELPPLMGDGKRSILDISCVDKSGTQYIVEMQNQRVPEFAKRTQMYASHAYVAQLDRGTDHLELSPVVLLAIANYTLFPDKKHYISYHKMLDVHTLEHDLKDVSYVFVDLTKFNKQKESELKTIVDKWLYFLKYWESIKCPPDVIVEPEILEAYNTMEQFNWSRSEMAYYLKYDMALTTEYAARKEAREEGKEEAEEAAKKTRKQELEKAEASKTRAIKEEREKAEISKTRAIKEEREKAHKEKIKIVEKMLSQGIDIQIIATVTGIAPDFISEIARKVG